MKERNALDGRIKTVLNLENALNDNLGLIEMGEAEGDESIVKEAEAAIAALKVEAGKREIETLLSGEADGNDTFVEINAGAGGTESQDWARILSRMYIRWAEQHGYKVEVLDEHAGEEAGIKSISFQVKGHNGYGYLKTESGVHRLVRISPFDSNARRHTSFASVWVYPVIDDNIQIEIPRRAIRAGGTGLSVGPVRRRTAELPRMARTHSQSHGSRGERSFRGDGGGGGVGA